LAIDDRQRSQIKGNGCLEVVPRWRCAQVQLHDLRKLVATVGEKLGLGDAVLRRILNHTAPKIDVLHRHYVGLNESDGLAGLIAIQEALVGTMKE
jgi:hypothetical protein